MEIRINSIKKIILLIVVTVSMILLGTNKVEASSFSITSGVSTTTVGKSYTITISAKGLTGRFNISHSSNVSVNVSSVWVENGVADSTIKVTTKKEGTATVTISPDSTGITDVNTEELVSISSKTDTVTVKSEASSNSSSSNSTSSSSGENTQAPSFATVNETVYATSSVNVRSSYSTSSSVIGSLNKGDSITRIGKGSNGWSKVKFNNQTAYISSSYLTTEKPEESNEKNLKSLTIDGDYELTPEFNKDVTEYTLSVGSDVESIKINAKAVDNNAKVEITGNDKLLMGENTVEIKVTAEDGTVRTYKINVTKGEETASSELGLSELSIDGYTLTPNFSTDVYEYKLDIDDETVTSLNINAKPFIEGTKIDVAGNDNLKIGENIITILVNSEDGKDVVTYQIIVNIKQKTEESNQIITGIDNKDLYLYTGIGLAVVLVLIIIIVILKHKSRDNKFEEFDGKVDWLNTEKENSSIKKSVIEENFGENVAHNDFTDEDTGRKKGKHF